MKTSTLVFREIVKFILIVAVIASAFLSRAALAGDEETQALEMSFGPVAIGEERIKFSLDEFPLVVETGSSKIEATWIENSVQWVRLKNNLMLPRARVRISSPLDSQHVGLLYLDKNLVLQQQEGGYGSASEFYISLFHPGKIEVFVDGKKVGTVRVQARANDKTDKHMIDYSCTPYGLEVKGLNGEFLSVSCQMIRVSEKGYDEPMLEVTWSSVNARMLDGRTPPFKTVFRNSNPAKTVILDSKNQRREVEMNVRIPNVLHRLKTAFGLGPYRFVSQKNESTSSSEYAPSVMLYANYYINDEFSLRSFEAATSNNPTKSMFFNNFGIYFAYEIGKALDNRVQTVALLGAQTVTFAHTGYNADDKLTQLMFPQGFEVTYSNAGKKGYLFGAGMFLFPSKENPYSNFWVRYGKKVFGELNYIGWKLNERRATMWGVSIGMPLFQAF